MVKFQYNLCHIEDSLSSENALRIKNTKYEMVTRVKQHIIDTQFVFGIISAMESIRFKMG